MRINLNKRLRLFLIFTLLILAIALTYTNVVALEASSHPILIGYQTVAYDSIYYSGLMTPNPFSHGINVTICKPIIKYENLSVLASIILYSNYSKILGTNELINVTHFPEYIAKYLLIDVKNVSCFKYNVILYDVGVYNITLLSGTAKGQLLLPVSALSYALNNFSKYIPGNYEIIVRLCYNNKTSCTIIYSQGNCLNLKINNIVIAYEGKIKENYINTTGNSFPLQLLQELCIHVRSYPNYSNLTCYEIVVNTTLGSLIYKKGIANSSIIPLNVTNISNYVSELLYKYGVYSSGFDIIVYIKNKSGNYTLDPYIVISNNAGFITITSYNSTVNMPVYLKEDFNRLNFIYSALPAAALILLLSLTKNKEESLKERTMRKLRKVKKILIETSEKPFVKEVIRVNDVDDIIKYSANLGKPIILYKGKNVLEVWSIDNDIGYVYSVNY
ncbi:hypothetical protein D1867_10675 [Acidianus infernus]|uniref:Uncharacterized protein n=1 Tax=Acidianus infernus TaxID=12915 RepID=A0A6A9QKF0_ACIIN|nr:hypothetical protein [Acidianus infernus]MUM65696.1 hypothetical protein [Acidianus infernus]